MNPNSKSFFDRVLVVAASPASISWQVFVPTALISALVQIFASGELDYQNIFPRSVAAVLSVIPMFGLIWLAHQVPIKNYKIKVLFILLIHGIAGSLRGLTLTLLLNLAGIGGGSLLDFRVQASFITMGLTVTLITYARATYLRHGASVAELASDAALLSSALEKIQQESRVESKAQLAEVSSRIISELKNIELTPAKDQMVAIQKLVDEQVRPLSIQFASELTKYEPAPKANKNLSLRDRLPSVESLTATPSNWFAVGVSITPFSLTAERFGILTALQLTLFIWLALTPSIILGMAFARKIIPQVPRSFQILTLTLVLILIAVPGAIASYLALLATPNPEIFIVGGIVTFPVYGLIVTFAGALFRDLRVQSASLTETTKALRWAIARANLLAWYNRGVTTRLLHGPVQNAMQAALLKLRTSDSKVEMEDVISALRERISLAGEGALERGGSSDLTLSFGELTELWRGVAKVSVAISDEARNALKMDTPVAAIAFDVCSEVCSNSIRHGKASLVAIKLDFADSLLKVVVEDNGQRAELKDSGGIGTRFLDSCSVSWELTRPGNDNQLVVYLPAESSSRKSNK